MAGAIHGIVPRGCFGEWLNLADWASPGVFNRCCKLYRSCGLDRHNGACLCSFSAPACLHDRGALINSGPCICGAVGACTSDTGLFCDAVLNGNDGHCSSFPKCANTNGTSSNAANCACGEANCDENTGRFCDVSQSLCAQFPAPRRVFLSTKYLWSRGIRSCQDAGYKLINDLETCRVAMDALNQQQRISGTSWLAPFAHP